MKRKLPPKGKKASTTHKKMSSDPIAILDRIKPVSATVGFLPGTLIPLADTSKWPEHIYSFDPYSIAGTSRRVSPKRYPGIDVKYENFYVVRDDLGRVKAGKTGNLEARYSELQRDNGGKLLCMAA